MCWRDSFTLLERYNSSVVRKILHSLDSNKVIPLVKSDLIVQQFTCNSNNNCQLQANTTLLEAVSPQEPGGYDNQTLPHTKYIIYMVETTEPSSTVL